MMPGIVELGSDPDLAPGDAGVFDSLPNLLFVAIGQCGINVAISGLQRNFDNVCDFIGLTLPCSQTDGWNLIAGIKGKGFPIEIQISYLLIDVRGSCLVKICTD